MIEKMIYEWRIKAVHEAINNNFMLLRNIQDTNTIWVLEFLDTLSYYDKLDFLSACVRRTMTEEIRDLIGIHQKERFNAKDILWNIHQQKTYMYYLKTLSLTNSGKSDEITPKMIKQAYDINEPLIPLRKLRSIVSKLLTDFFGKPISNSYGRLEFDTHINNYSLITDFSNEGYTQLRMYQEFKYFYRDKKFTIYPNILAKIGLIGAQGVGWDRIQENTVEVFKENLLAMSINVLEDLSENFK